MNSFISSSDANEEHRNFGIYVDSESIKSNNSSNLDQPHNNSENQQIQENDIKPVTKIHHNVSSFSELGDFLSESTTIAPTTNSTLTKETTKPKQDNQNKRKKKPLKRQPIKINFSKIFGEDTEFGFNDDQIKKNNTETTNIKPNISFASFDHEIMDNHNPEHNSVVLNQQNEEDNIKTNEYLDNIENRIFDYFNHSVNMMISDFLNDLKVILNGSNIIDSTLQSFTIDLKKNIRQIINFKVPYSDFFNINDIDSSLLQWKDILLDIESFNPDKISKTYSSIKDCEKSVSSQIEKINLKIAPSVDKFKNELSELHQLQHFIQQKEAKANFRRSSIFQHLSDLEYREIIQKMESDLFYLQRSRTNISYHKPDDESDKRELLSQIYRFIKHYKRLQNDTYYKENIKRYSRLIYETSDDFQNSCDIYNLKIKHTFSTINYAQNQKNISLISNYQLNMTNNLNSNSTNAISTIISNEDNKKKAINTNQKKNINEKEDFKNKKKRVHHKSEIRYIEDLRHHGHRRIHRKFPK